MPYRPTESVREAARRGLELRAEQPESNRAGTAVGIARARDLSNGERISIAVIRRMVSYFARHEADKEGEGWGKDSKGYQAWLMWGGDPGRAWAEAMLKRHESKEKPK